MEPINCNITLRDGVDEGTYRRYEPGSVIRGVVQIVPNQDINCRKGAVRLWWRTEGKGDRNSDTIQETELWEGNLLKGRPIEADFRFQLPTQPWSYSGHYINIVWEIFVYVDVPLAGDPKFSKGFVLRPGGENNW